MTDNSVVHDVDDDGGGRGGDDDDVSKIITQFLLGTCQLHQPSVHDATAAMCVFALS